MKVEYINPFIEASQSVLKSVANINVELGKPYLKDSPYPSDILAIIIGLTGKLRGQVIFSLSKDIALKVASSMMGTELKELDELAKSAVAEAANMILGNTATIFFNTGISIDITPPTLLTGDNIKISTNKIKTVCIPLNIVGGGLIDIDVAVEG